MGGLGNPRRTGASIWFKVFRNHRKGLTCNRMYPKQHLWKAVPARQGLRESRTAGKRLSVLHIVEGTIVSWHDMSHHSCPVQLLSHLSGMSEVPSVTPCSADRDFSSGIPTFSRKQSAGSARMALYRSYPEQE